MKQKIGSAGLIEMTDVVARIGGFSPEAVSHKLSYFRTKISYSPLADIRTVVRHIEGRAIRERGTDGHSLSQCFRLCVMELTWMIHKLRRGAPKLGNVC